MYKNIVKVVFVAAIAVACGVNVFNAQKSETLSEVALVNVEALASIDPECPNGCIEGGDGCYCYKDFPESREAKWPAE